MIQPPEYFERIRQNAIKRWEQLEGDPEIAAPTHQLFKQVQSPRHVISELLQNADDAGATKASARIEDEDFIFEHNGEDFTEEQFESLCRFGYSNKRILHTIGFRGIGFKSTFSLGEKVSIYTPTLALYFHKDRFTEPVWTGKGTTNNGTTCVRIKIKNQNCMKELEKNLNEWHKSALSLLFFRNIRHITICNEEIHWKSLGKGPVANSEYMALNGDKKNKFLLIRSEYEIFPDYALEEISEERMISEEDMKDYPPSRIEIVLGAKGHLFVVLPTQVETNLPFACNAPFIQDPARLKIKDPETSPTNHWLLKRAARLAAETFLKWVSNKKLPDDERANAYDAFPDVMPDGNTIEDSCEIVATQHFIDFLKDEKTLLFKNIILTKEGELKNCGECTVVPEVIFEVWPNIAWYKYDESSRNVFSYSVKNKNRSKLLRWKFINQVTKDNIILILHNFKLPKPSSWNNLLILWVYLASDITDYKFKNTCKTLNIIPVQFGNTLLNATDIFRLGDEMEFHSDSDLEFISSYIFVLNSGWLRFLLRQSKQSMKNNDNKTQQYIEAAKAILQTTGLDKISDMNKIVQFVASKIFNQNSPDLSSCVRISQIAAKFHIEIDESFHFFTRGLTLKEADSGIVYDSDGSLEDLFPSNWKQNNFLHSDYTHSYQSCTKDEWNKWVNSGRSMLFTFAPFSHCLNHRGKQEALTFINHYSLNPCSKIDISKYRTNEFICLYWDFEKVIWDHWYKMAEEDPGVWARIMQHILNLPKDMLSEALKSSVLQKSTSKKETDVTPCILYTRWVEKFQNLPCLPDNNGINRKPIELFRRSNETEAFEGIEYFVHKKLDIDANREIFDYLRVQKVPTGPERILYRLRVMSKTNKPQLDELDNLYKRIDKVIGSNPNLNHLNNESDSIFETIKKAFFSENIIYTTNSGWVNGFEVFISCDKEEAPFAPVIRDSVKNLSLWKRIGIEERPTVHIIIRWLESIPSGKILSEKKSQRVKYFMKRYPIQIWNACGHWLNLSGEWVPSNQLEYSISERLTIEWENLFDSVKQITANLYGLPYEILESRPFSKLVPLVHEIEERIESYKVSNNSEEKPWITQAGCALCRIKRDDIHEEQRIRGLGQELRETKWHISNTIGVVPYIDGTPVGDSRIADVYWSRSNKSLYVTDLPGSKLAKLVPEELSKHFNSHEVSLALNFCYDRTIDVVDAYFKDNFELSENESPIQSPNPRLSSDKRDNPYNSLEPSQTEQRNFSDEQDISHNLQEPSPTDSRPPDNSKHDSHVDNNPQPLIEYRTQHEHAPKELSIMDRFASARGFKWDENHKRFTHLSDGKWIGKTNGNIFHWELHDPEGNLICYYWPENHCLEKKPLELKAEVWKFIKMKKIPVSLILSDTNGKPVEVLGEYLMELVDSGKIKVHSASIRLVYEKPETDA